MIETIPTAALWLLYGVAGMFFTLAAIIAAAALVYPFYIIFEEIRERVKRI